MTVMDQTTKLAVAELVIYIHFFLVAHFLLVKHGRHGIEAWLFFAGFCILRIIAAGLQIDNWAKYSKGKPTGNTANILNGVGVAGLLLSLSGIIHEASAYQNNYNQKKAWTISTAIHIVIVTGIALAATGGAELSGSTTYSQLHTWKGLLIAGYFIILSSMICLFLFSAFTLRELRRNGYEKATQSAKILVYGVVVALVIVLVRVFYSIVFGFTLKPSLSPYNGSFAIKLVFISLVQMLAAVIILFVGLKTINIKQELLSDKQRQSATNKM